MGSGRSKSSRGSSSAVIGDANDVDGSERRRRSKSLFCGLQSSCLASSSASHDSDDDDEQVCNGWMRKSHGSISSHRMNDVVESENQRDAADCYKELELKKSENGRHCNELELEDECDAELNVSNVPIRNGGESSSVSMNTPGRVFSHFKFIPGNISSRLSRASSSRSFNAYPVSSSGQRIEQEGITSPSESAVPVIENVVRDIDGMRFGEDDTIRSPRVVVNGMGSTYGGILDRRHVIREHSERNVRFSRTLSVGRLRDRVLRRSSLSDFTFRPSPYPGEDSDLSYAETALVSGTEVSASSVADNTPMTSTSLLGRSTSSIRRTLFGTQDQETSTPLARYQGLLEHRSDFLERRRRIRSQVRALQRLGSRFETVTGHERSCVLAGQDQSGRCTCRGVNRGSTTTTDETNARASISRIVLLAEALFEVLDEIHQQSVVLSSQPSVSSIGSIPAPNEVVESLPLKLFTKSHKDRNEDTSQCYICLVEYEEGDSIRTLPCNHEFHRACVDKWLKEIHRVCPLCRGDICRHETALELH